METYPMSPLEQSLQRPSAHRLLSAATIVMVLIAAGLLFLTVKGYGTLQLQGIPANATVTLNGHTIQSNSLTLRPGDYRLVVTSPVITPYEHLVHVGLL